MSVNEDAKILKLTCKKLQIDGSVFSKIEIFSNSGAEYNFLQNGQKIADIIARLNLCKDSQNWLSMQPNPLRYYSDSGLTKNFGEHKEDNEENGRGIRIFNNGDICIGYFENGRLIGNLIAINSDGTFYVGENYLKDGRILWRGTQYKTDGSELKI